MRILGISAFYHDSAAALLVDGKIAAAAQEERFTRKKHDPNFPAAAIRYCLSAANITAGELDHVVFYEKPFLKFERLLETYLAFAPRGFQSFRKAIPVWLKEKLFQKSLLRDHLREIDDGVDWEAKFLFADHHQSHAASAFFASPFAESAILTLDGVGEWTTTSAGYGKDNTLDLTREINFPHSVGLLYSAFTYYTGFRVNSGEYKVMGLAPYGEPKYSKLILDHLVDLKDDGSFRLDLQYFDYCTGLTMTNGRFDALFGGKPRGPSERLDQRHMDLAASVQQVTEEIVLRLTRSLAREGRSENLCLAGGVALNCVANGKILRERHFKNIWVQPAAGDAGGAVGAALAAYHQFAGKPRAAPTGDAMSGGYLGPSFAQAEIEQRLAQAGAVFSTLTDEALIDGTVKALVAEKAVGWFQGRMEFGPRALGRVRSSAIPGRRACRVHSICASSSAKAFARLRRPCCARMLRTGSNSTTTVPYMQLVADVLPKHRRPASPGDEKLFGIERLNIPRSDIPAVTHVDYSARIQTVHADTNARFHALLTAFKAATGCPVLVNTSFNVRGEPIVCTPDDAFRCFMGSDIEVLVVGNCFLNKEDQPELLKLDYKNAFELD